MSSRTRKLEDLEARLRRSRTGSEVHAVFSAHAEEVMQLINHRRQVTVVWHRNHGPEFIGHVVKSGFEDDFSFPQEINGVTMEQLLRRMASVMLDYGSPGLRAVIGEYYQLVLSWVGKVRNLSQLLDEIARMDETRPGDN